MITYLHINHEPSGNETTSSIELIANPISDERFEEISSWPLELYSESQIDQMQAYLLPKAYRITIYAEHENHEPITNTVFMRELFRNKVVKKYLETQLGSELTPAIEFAIHIENLGNSGVFELHIQRGSKEESLELAYIVMEAIRNDEIPVLDKKNVSLITQEPEIIVRDYSEFTGEKSNAPGISVKMLIKDILIFNIIAVVLALIIGVLISILYQLKMKKFQQYLIMLEKIQIKF